jgi:hypothetical protein
VKQWFAVWSAQLETNSQQTWLLCGLGDGALVYIEFNPLTGEFLHEKKIALGEQSTLLSAFANPHKSSDSLSLSQHSSSLSKSTSHSSSFHHCDLCRSNRAEV